MAASPSWLRIAVVQFAPKLGEVNANIAKARELCRGLTPRSVDLVCFPEMIFSGYMFTDGPSIAPYLEHRGTGPTSTFCAELARHLQCYVVAGYPERLEPAATQRPAGGSGPQCSPSPISTPVCTMTATTAPPPPSPSPTLAPPSSSADSSPPLGPIGANAAVLYDSTGRLLHAYHKSNLFQTDLTWARAGPGFAALDLPVPFGRTAVAICNDLNVGGGAWHSIESGPYELGEYCRREGVSVLLLLNAWLRGEEEDGGGEVSGSGGGGDREGDRDRIASASADGDGRLEDDGTSDADSEGTEDGSEDDGSEPDWRVLNYWAMRLRPLWAKDVDGHTDAETRPAETAGTDERERLVVVCNRFGRERGKTFAGSSAMFSMRVGSGRPRLIHAMGRREEGVSVWTARIGSRMLA